jgi:cytochrome c peroxidase
MYLLSLLLVLMLGLAGGAAAGQYAWNLPEGFEPPPVPADDPMTVAKVQLGRHLFYDKRISGNGRQACASCHIQRLAFTDGRPRAVGSTGQVLARGSMSLVNVAWRKTLTWNNPSLTTLEQQMLIPLFGTNPVELGVEAEGNTFLSLARRDKRYQELFRRAYPDNPDRFRMVNVIRAIACFERTLISANSAWDVDWRQVQHLYGLKMDFSRSSEAARRGEVLFFEDKLSCGRCHGGNNFDSTVASAEEPQTETIFHDNGLGSGAPGLSQYTNAAADFGKFKAPTMRNIELTGPYMHDGSLPSLEAVIEHYRKGGGHTANQSPLVHGFELSPDERDDLLAFLRSLTDVSITRDPRFSDPWTVGRSVKGPRLKSRRPTRLASRETTSPPPEIIGRD